MTGYLLRQDYTEGSFVRKGQLLFEIDPRPFQAALDRAKGTGEARAACAGKKSVARSERAGRGRRGESGQDRARRQSLHAAGKGEAITDQELDNAVQANLAAKAEVAAARARVETAKAAIEAAEAAIEAPKRQRDG